MSEDRWNHVKLIVEQAAELAGPQRSEYLNQACGDDTALRSEVDALLVSCEQAPAFLEQPAIVSFADLIASDSADDLVGRRIGAWRIINHIATGGMGSVFLAERADRQYEQRVAVKLVRHGMVDADSLRRFRNERQTLANLDHPNIARLLDGGVTEDGLPYLAMDFVEGQPIDTFCDQRSLSTAQRLRLFLKVCQGVRYAHQNLVVHRDLKPGNILVTADGVPKVLDFGIAKALDVSSDSEPHDQTLPERRLMTPAYASPEQIRGEPITTASDVYSLGVVLYELLTGHRPFHPKSSSIYEVERAVCEQEPTRPSAIVTKASVVASGAASRTVTPETISATRDGQPSKLRRRLLGDIDAIVLTAIRKNPDQRYTSVEALAEDIRRHLVGLPIHARDAGLIYRTSRFVRRNAIGVSASAAVAVSLIGGIVATAWQRDLAVLAQQRAERETAGALVEARKAERVTGFLQEMIGAVDPGHAGRDIMVRDLLEQAAERVHQIFGEDPEVESAIRTTLGQTLLALGEYDRAERQLRAALDIQANLHGESHPDVARALSRLATVLYAQGMYDEAERYSTCALDMLRKLYGVRHEDIAQELNNLGAITRAAGGFDQAETLLLEALKMRRELFGDVHGAVAETLNNLANLARWKGNLAAAERLSRSTFEIRRELLGDDHVDTVQAMENLAVVLAGRAQFDEAGHLLRLAIEKSRAALGDLHPSLATSLMNLGGLHNLRQRYAEAEPLFREALKIRRASLPPDAPRTVQSLRLLGECLLMQNRPADAEPYLMERYERNQASFGARHVHTYDAVSSLVQLYETWGKPDRAEEFSALLPVSTSSPTSIRAANTP